MVGLCERLMPVIVVLTLFALPGMPAAVGKAVRRDTDETAILREKLHKLHALLSDLYADDTKGDAAPAVNSDLEHPDVKVNDEPESDDSKELGALNSKNPTKVERSEIPSKDDESVQILARALSKLRKPEYDMEDSAGEYLGTSYNEPPHRVREMEDVVERALIRLRQGRNRHTGQEERQNVVGTDHFDEGQFGEFVAPGDVQEERLPPLAPPTHEGRYHEDALKAVELRLMRDLELAARLGVSVDELIDDLDRKAYKEAELREVEQQLSSLRRRPYK